jgi:lipopolysaccharide biosynthesis regulator YciM
MYIAIAEIIFFIIIMSAILFYIAVKIFYKKNSNVIPVEYLQSMNYLLSDEHDKALNTFMSMVSVSKDNAETHIILGNLFRNRGEVDRAIRIHQNLIARPELTFAIRQQCLTELAKDYLKAGFLDRAELIFIKLSKDAASPVSVLIHLKEIYELEKEWQKAIDVSIKIQMQNNEDLSDTISHYYCELAEIEISMKNIYNMSQAKKYINKAVSYNKKSLRALILLGDISFKKGNHIDSIKQYLNVYESYPEQSYLVIDKIKIAYENLNTKENFYDFLKSFSKTRNSLDLYSSLNKDQSSTINHKEISEIYQQEFESNRVNLIQLSEYVDLIEDNKIAFDKKSLSNIQKCLKVYSEKESSHKCENCGFVSIKHFWQCPSCQSWSSIRKKILSKNKSKHYVI